MLFHHDARTYDEAATAAAIEGRKKLLAQIERDRASAENVLREIDQNVPADSLIPLAKVRVESEGGRLRFEDGRDLTPWASSQLAEKVGMPTAFLNSLLAGGGERADLAAYNLTRLAGMMSDRVLVRAVKNEVRGVLSDRFRRIDVRPSFQAFIERAIANGAVPLSGVISDTRASLRVVMPTVYEPVPGEVISIGLAHTNSDVGNGAEAVSLFIDRLWCTNIAISHSELRVVHLGKRLTDNEFKWSEETMRLDSEASVSAVRDVVDAALSPEKVKGLLDMVAEANAAKVESRDVEGFLKKALGSKTAVAEATKTFASAEVELLPAGQTTWRLSNVLSLLAQSAPTADLRLDYERAAGDALLLARAA